MANRVLLAKVERASTQRRELGAVESGKDFYLYAHHYEKPVTRDELAALCVGVKVKRFSDVKVRTASLIVDGKTISADRIESVARKSGTWRKRSGTCERRLWIGKPPRI